MSLIHPQLARVIITAVLFTGFGICIGAHILPGIIIGGVLTFMCLAAVLMDSATNSS